MHLSKPLKYTIEDVESSAFNKSGTTVFYSSNNLVRSINLNDVRHKEVKQNSQFPVADYDVIDLTNLDEVENKKEAPPALSGSIKVREASTIVVKESVKNK